MIPSRVTSSPLVYLRLVYRLPLMAVTMLACFLFAQVTGWRGACRLWAILASRICGRQLEISGAPPDPAAQLVIANHVSYLDLIPIFYLWPACHPVAMGHIRSWFFIGWLLRDSVIFVDEGDPDGRCRARGEMRRVWKHGGTLLVFPEGIIAERRGRFHVGSFEEAIRSGVAIQGARISYAPELVAALNGRLFEERFFWVLCQNLRIRIHVFEAEPAAGDAAELSSAWERRLLSDGARSKPEPGSPRQSAPLPSADVV
jgi:1-acyl-sn-glycerol-3-phosphate acyltransferase